jgi:hypothetical protein
MLQRYTDDQILDLFRLHNLRFPRIQSRKELEKEIYKQLNLKFTKYQIQITVNIYLFDKHEDLRANLLEYLTNIAHLIPERIFGLSFLRKIQATPIIHFLNRHTFQIIFQKNKLFTRNDLKFCKQCFDLSKNPRLEREMLTLSEWSLDSYNLPYDFYFDFSLVSVKYAAL